MKLWKKQSTFLEKQTYLIFFWWVLFWFPAFIENKFLLVYGIANLRQCFISTEYLNFKNRECEEQWINRSVTNVSWIKQDL